MASGEKIRVMIVDDVSETRENVRKLLQFESDVDVVGVFIRIVIRDLDGGGARTRCGRVSRWG